MASSWEPYKDIIRTQYLLKNKPLKDVMSHMRENHGLAKDLAQYKRILRKWGFTKKSKADDWRTVHHKIDSRRKQGRASAVYRHGRLISKSKLFKEARHKLSTGLERYGQDPSPKTPESFSICTPTASDPPLILINQMPTVQIHNSLLMLLDLYSIGNPHNIGQAESYMSLVQSFSSVIAGSTSTILSKLRQEHASKFISQMRLLSTLQTAGAHQLQTLQPLETPSKLENPHMICLLMYLISNNRLDRLPTETVMNILLQSGGRTLLERLIDSKLPATKALVRILFPLAISNGNAEMLGILVRSGRDLNMPVKWGSRPLHLALERGDINMIRLLLEGGAVLDSCSLQSSVESGRMELVELLLSHVTNINARGRFGCTALYVAAEHGALAIAQTLLLAGADPTCPSSNGTTALEIAAARGHFHMVWLLLTHYAESSSSTFFTSIPQALITAARNGHLDILELLLSQGVKIQPSEHFRALQAASKKGHIQTVQALLEVETRISILPIKAGHDLLSSAAYSGSLEVVNLFLSYYEADREAYRSHSSESADIALQLAAGRGFIEVVQALIRHGADVNAPVAWDLPFEQHVSGTAIQAAAYGGHMDIVQLLLDEGAEVGNEFDEDYKFTALQAACKRGHMKIAQLLLRHGADVNSWPADREGLTALQAAALSGKIAIVQLLLDHGAHVNADPATRGGLTALQAALRARDSWSSAHKEAIEIVRLFIQLDNTCIDAPPSPFDGRDALTEAIHNLDKEAAELLLEHGAKLDTLYGGDCNQFLCWAISSASGWVQLLIKFGFKPSLWTSPIPWEEWIEFSYGWTDIELLLDAGLDVENNSGSGLTLLQCAVLEGYLERVQFFLERGADVNAPAAGKGGRTALQAAAEAGEMAIIRLLLEWRADVNGKPALDAGVTALQAAAISGDIDVIVLLLEKEADVNAPAADKDGRTALEAAAEHGRLDTVQILLNVGAQISGTRAVKLAMAEGHDGVVMLLESYGK